MPSRMLAGVAMAALMMLMPSATKATETGPRAPALVNAGTAEAPSATPAAPLAPATAPAALPAAAAPAAPATPATSATPPTPAAVADTAAAAAAAAETPPKPAPRPEPTLRVAIDLSRQQMTVSENGVVRHVWSISSGRAGYRTPTGTYRGQWMSRMHYSRKYDNAPMPHSVFFHNGFAIHATYATGMLGRPASHGCIRLAPANAKTFYGLVARHGLGMTRIAIHGTARDSAPAIAQRKTYRAKVQQAWSGYAPWGAEPAPAARAQVVRVKPKPTYSLGAAPAKYTWPGDAPRRSPRG
ncbi:MAG: L,D-transpeptidase [Hyphomicrobiaceae bacterium]|nr:L,D-transpeptidase [Hyphomicrobiaceae bacterium]